MISPRVLGLLFLLGFAVDIPLRAQQPAVIWAGLETRHDRIRFQSHIPSTFHTSVLIPHEFT
jgi:hypothetical protein